MKNMTLCTKKLYESYTGKLQKSTARYVIFKLLKDRENLDNIKEKWQIMYRGATIRLVIDFSLEVIEIKGSRLIYCSKEK